MQYCSENGQSSPVFVETVPTPVNKTGSWRFLTPVRKEKISPCRVLCPLENEIPRWMKEVKVGKWQEAWKIVRRYNPFPAITGYTCYGYCMEECSRALLDEAVAIRQVEKEIGLWRCDHFDPEKTPAQLFPSAGQLEKAKRVAIVGSGPAGLSSAYYLNSMGMEVTVLEKLPVAGGLLATGIPEYRLPRSVLKKELEILQAKGIVISTGLEVGNGGIGLQDLQDDYDAVLLAVGAQESRPVNISGDNLPGVTEALEFLKSLNTGGLPAVKGQVVVIGGGNAALDAACMARRHGAEEVTLLYRRSEKEMPAHLDEIKAAEEVGVKFIFHTFVREIIGRGKVQGVRTLQTRPSRRGETVVNIPGTDLVLECNQVILAAGQESGLKNVAPFFAGGTVPQQAPPVDEKILVGERFPVEKQSLTKGKIPSGEIIKVLAEDSQKLLVAAGDAVTGSANVAAAILGGRLAALSIYHAFQAGKEDDGERCHIAPPVNGREEVVTGDALNPLLFRKHERCPLPQEEASRCFSCGTCSQCGVCWLFCPDLAIEHSSGDYVILLDYCKGCGICAAECPSGVLELEEVGNNGA
jgi:NADPH-dependent glutamate synthase beta subunit-like oxidoreductase